MYLVHLLNILFHMKPFIQRRFCELVDCMKIGARQASLLEGRQHFMGERLRSGLEGISSQSLMSSNPETSWQNLFSQEALAIKCY